jgi:hypothetical protein
MTIHASLEVKSKVFAKVRLGMTKVVAERLGITNLQESPNDRQSMLRAGDYFVGG